MTRHPSEDSHPYWSPDGTRIIFNSNRDGGKTDEVYTMKADGTEPRRLTQNDIYDTYASFSPDGKEDPLPAALQGARAHLRRQAHGVQLRNFAMNADGSDPVNLTRQLAFDGWPSWPPDGKRIAFGPAVPVRSGCSHDCGRLGRPATPGKPGEGELSPPDWSPDG